MFSIWNRCSSITEIAGTPKQGGIFRWSVVAQAAREVISDAVVVQATTLAALAALVVV